MRAGRRRAQARAPTYPLRLFGSFLADLLDNDTRTQAQVGAAVGISQPTLSGYRAGHFLPADETAVRAIAKALAPSKRKLPRIRNELLERWRADLLEADLRAKEQTVADTRKALDRIEEARR